MVHRRPRYIVDWMPRVKGKMPGSSSPGSSGPGTSVGLANGGCDMTALYGSHLRAFCGQIRRITRLVFDTFSTESLQCRCLVAVLDMDGSFPSPHGSTISATSPMASRSA